MLKIGPIALGRDDRPWMIRRIRGRTGAVDLRGLTIDWRRAAEWPRWYAANRAVVIDMIAEKKQQAVAMLGIFHDTDVRDAVADRLIDVTTFAPRQAA